MQPMSDHPFQLVGYREPRLVGQGGLGKVYCAVRESTNGLVAIKELQHVGATSPAWHRARRELEALLRLKGHPYVVSVEEIVDGPTGPCLVMEYLPGGSLSDRVERCRLSSPELVVVGQHVSQALAAAHACGIVHRDVKPHNLLIGAFGQVKVCDFGIATVARGDDGRTVTQAVTLAYASPEELDGDVTIGPPTDAYSFGATFAHLLTGRKPSFQERMAGRPVVIDDVTVDVALRPAVAMLTRCLLHDPLARPTMAELVTAFDAAAASLGDRRIMALPPEPSLSPPYSVSALPISAADTRHRVAPTVVRPAPSPKFVPTDPATVPHSSLETVVAPTALRPALSPPMESPLTAPPPSRIPRLLVGASIMLALATVASAFILTHEGGSTPSVTALAASTTVVAVTVTNVDPAAAPLVTTATATVEATVSPVTTVASVAQEAQTRLALIAGVSLVGQACRDSVASGGGCPDSQQGSWAFVLTFASVAPDGLAADGTLEWPELGSLHVISATTDGSMIRFVETAAISSGQALLGCQYDIGAASATGRWSCPDGSAGPFELR